VKLPKVKIPRLLIASSILTLLGLALMVWSVIQPSPLPTILAMSLGQLIGMTAFGLYILAIVIDLRRDARAHRRALDEGPPPPPRGESAPP
jgi:hypothetical protein